MSETDRYLLTDARVRTLDPERPRASWVLVAGERIEDLGEGEPPPVRPAFRLDGAHVVPGLVDAHTHLAHWGELATRLDLAGASSREDAMERLRERIRAGASAGDPAGVLIAERWDESLWPDRAFPTRAAIDAVAGSRPVVLRRVCCHIAVANTAALARIDDTWEGVDRETGVLLEGPCLSLSRIFPPAFEDVLRSARKGARDAARFGITAVQEMVGPETLRAYVHLDAKGELPIDVTFHTPERLRDEAFRLAIPTGFRRGRLRRGGIKLFLDGSLGGRSAALVSEYADQPGARGLLLFPFEELTGIVRRAEECGIQLAMHAIGDAAIDLAIRSLAAGGAPSSNPLRHRIEHFEVLDPALLARAAERGVVACVQPNFLAQWSRPGGLYERRLGPARFAWNNPFREMRAAGVRIAFSSDTMPLSTAFGLEAAHHAPLERQRLDGIEILRAYTTGAAYAGWDEAERGAIRAGALADLSVWSHDPAAAESFPGARVLLTIARGRRTHLAKDGWPAGAIESLRALPRGPGADQGE